MTPTPDPTQPASTDPAAQDARRAVEARRDANLARIRRVIAVMSGKGGVGKSTVATSLALGLARLGHATGLLDVDFHGPSVPTLLGLGEAEAIGAGQQLKPATAGEGLKVMSLGLLIGPGDRAVIWRGPMKIGVINQLLGEVDWGDLDFLVLDCPPGTGDEPLSIGQIIPTAEVVMVGTPQEVAMADVRKAVSFCRQLGLTVLGLVETMGTVRCAACGQPTPLFARRDGARPEDLPVLARIPFDPALQAACDSGRLATFIDEEEASASALRSLAEAVAGGSRRRHTGAQEPGQAYLQEPVKGESAMRYAIPTADGRLTAHFGHADQFALVDVSGGQVGAARFIQPPPHAPGVLPRWLKEQGVEVILAGGMGQRAQSLFAANGIAVVVGAEAAAPEDLVRRHLDGTLQAGPNICDH